MAFLSPAAVAQSGAQTDPGASGRDPVDPPAQQRSLSREERVHWFLDSTVGPANLAGGVVSAAWSTGFNNPEEYGPHWDGFAKRYGIRLTGIATSNAIEAGLGAVWDEAPRYVSVGEGSIWSRVRNAAKMTVLAERADGSTAPAYARYAAIGGSNFLSNTWRVESDSTTGAALGRIGLGFAARFGSNIFGEFWPDIHHKLLGHK